MSVQLAVTSYYSLLESTLSIQDILNVTKENGAKTVALTDHNVMYGSIAFYRACLKNNIKPIIGLEVDIVLENVNSTLYLYAKNNQGYKKLVYLSTLLNTNMTILTLDELLDNKDLIVILPSCSSVIESKLFNDDYLSIEEIIEKYQRYFESFYLGLSRQDEVFYQKKNQILKDICKKYNVLTCAFIENKSLEAKDSFLLKALNALRNKTNVYDASIVEEKYQYFHSTDELLRLYSEDDLFICDQIADLCEIDIDKEHCELLKYPNNKGVSNSEYLKQLCLAGLRKRLKSQQIPNQYLNRLYYELNIISKMHYDDYFLIVYDFILFARRNQIYVGPGRGSSAGSLVAYSLGITHIDPIQYDLLFERFLNPDRISMPDIDVDFPDDKRMEVIEYVCKKYGKDKVAHIIAFSTLQARAAIDSACEALRVDKRRLEPMKRFLPKFVSDKSKSTLKETLNTNSRLQILLDEDSDCKEVYQLAMKLEGMPRNITTHACGMVMSDKPLTDVIPLCKVNEEILSTQISADYLEELGLLKMDFLGIRNLTIIDNVCQSINPKIDILKIPVDDYETYEMISKGYTTGLFQLESSGMTNLIRRLKPRNLLELSDTIALYRPGAMDGISTYLENRKNPSKIVYPHKDLEPILSSTYGLIIYQEQAMQIAQKVAGFTLAKADILRKAMGKKKEKELLSLKEDFINGCLKNNYSSELANSLYDSILKFAGYGFNKSHSCAYALVGYQMAFLKTHYPDIFLCHLLNNVIGSENKTYEYIQEAKRMNTTILPVSLNHSTDVFEMEDKCIRMPFHCLKGFGLSQVSPILKEREKRGPFTNFFDSIARLNICKINKSSIETLIKAGAMDEFGSNRSSLLASLDEAIRYANLIKVENPDQTTLDFDLVYKPTLTIVKEDMFTRLSYEEETYGFYFSKHPIEYLKEKCGYNGISLKDVSFNSRVNLIVHISRIKNHLAKTGNMAFVTIDDESMSMDGVILPSYYEKYHDILKVNSYYSIEGRVDNRSEQPSIVIEKMNLLNNPS